MWKRIGSSQGFFYAAFLLFWVSSWAPISSQEAQFQQTNQPQTQNWQEQYENLKIGVLAIAQQLDEQLQTVKASLEQSLQEQNQVKEQLQTALNSLGESKSEVTVLRARLAELATQITDLQTQIDELSTQLDRALSSWTSSDASRAELNDLLEIQNLRLTEETKMRKAAEDARLVIGAVASVAGVLIGVGVAVLIERLGGK